jgi:ribonuclease T
MNDQVKIAPEVQLIIVDIEIDGPIPGQFSILSIGAVDADNRDRQFYIEIQPVTDNYDEDTLAISGLDREKLKLSGVKPKRAMREFETWLTSVCGERQPIFVSDNVAFDWMFVCYYFWRYRSHNPLGHSALDIRSYSMGAFDTSWPEASLKKLPLYIRGVYSLSHNALEDAVAQAELFSRIRGARGRRDENLRRTYYERDVLDMD